MVCGLWVGTPAWSGLLGLENIAHHANTSHNARMTEATTLAADPFDLVTGTVRGVLFSWLDYERDLVDENQSENKNEDPGIKFRVKNR